jgi:hypothetical protein
VTVKAQYVQREGRQVIQPLSAERIEFFKKKIKLGDFVALEFKKWADSRTDRQNRYLHALIHRYKDVLGYSMEDAKNELCINFGISVLYEPESWDPPDWGGHFALYHHELYFRKSTREYTTVEMKALIDGIKLACFENGIDIDDIEPED